MFESSISENYVYYHQKLDVPDVIKYLLISYRYCYYNNYNYNYNIIKSCNLQKNDYIISRTSISDSIQFNTSSMIRCAISIIHHTINDLNIGVSYQKYNNQIQNYDVHINCIGDIIANISNIVYKKKLKLLDEFKQYIKNIKIENMSKITNFVIKIKTNKNINWLQI